MNLELPGAKPALGLHKRIAAPTLQYVKGQVDVAAAEEHKRRYHTWAEWCKQAEFNNVGAVYRRD